MLNEMAAGEAGGAGNENGAAHPLLGSLFVLRGVVGAEGGVVFLDRTPPPLVAAIPLDRRPQPLFERHLRRPPEPAQLRGVQTVASIVALPIGDRLDERQRLAE